MAGTLLRLRFLAYAAVLVAGVVALLGLEHGAAARSHVAHGTAGSGHAIVRIRDGKVAYLAVDHVREPCRRGGIVVVDRIFKAAPAGHFRYSGSTFAQTWSERQLTGKHSAIRVSALIEGSIRHDDRGAAGRFKDVTQIEYRGRVTDVCSTVTPWSATSS